MKCLNCKHRIVDTEGYNYGFLKGTTIKCGDDNMLKGIRFFTPKLKEYKEKLRRHEEFIKKMQDKKDKDSTKIIKE